ncbi:unnamed protein product, partial [Mesorhabditis spiculigera]
MGPARRTYSEYLSASEELLEERELSAESESPTNSLKSRTSLLRKTNTIEPCTWLPFFLAALLIFIFTATVMFVVLLMVNTRDVEDYQMPNSSLLWQDNQELSELSKALQRSFNASEILSSLKYLAQGIHIAGTRDNAYVMKWIAEKYESFGIPVKLYNYTVLLNYPNFMKPNTIHLKNENTDEWQLLSDGLARAVAAEKIRDQQIDRRGMLWWNAYSGNGSFEGRIVYVNYGFKKDFDTLKQRGIDINGCIALIRLGALSRSEKVREAEKAGAGGVIFFSDPLHHASVDPNLNFPNDTLLPGSDAQRGSLLGTVGDPETPGLPSLPYVSRYETIDGMREKGFIPTIPVMPIGYEDATRIMHSLNGGPVMEPSWHGGLDTTYRYTGSHLFRLTVHSSHVHRTITNVVATIKGMEEPDRWVMAGNHADAWTYGAIDPLSGTATMIDMAKAFSRLPPPRRTIVFCHFDAEEFGLIGSTEYLEEFANVLATRAVAYINVDHIPGNATVDARSVPLLYRLLADASSRVPQQNSKELASGKETLFDSWINYSPSQSVYNGDRSIPEIAPPTLGSDYQRFISYLGVPVADLKMESPPAKSYSLYHTMHDIPYLVDLLHPEGKALVSMGQMWAETVFRLANDLIIPLNVMDYSRALQSMKAKTFQFLRKIAPFKNFDPITTSMENLDDALQRLATIANWLEVVVADVSHGTRGLTPIQVEQLNSRITQFERVFLDPLAQSPLHKHLLYSPAKYPVPSGVFTVISDLAIQLLHEKDSLNRTSIYKAILHAVSRLQYSVEKAIHLFDIDNTGF